MVRGMPRVAASSCTSNTDPAEEGEDEPEERVVSREERMEAGAGIEREEEELVERRGARRGLWRVRRRREVGRSQPSSVTRRRECSEEVEVRKEERMEVCCSGDSFKWKVMIARWLHCYNQVF